MFRSLIIVSTFLLIAITPQQSNAESQKKIENMIRCLHDVPFTNRGLIFNCPSILFDECFKLIDVTDKADLKTVRCFVSHTDDVKLKMENHFRERFPNQTSYGYHLGQTIFEYAIKRSELRCAYERKIMNLSEINQIEVYPRRLNTFEAGCLLNYMIESYWAAVVHDKLYW